jgi:hypothetical protein
VTEISVREEVVTLINVFTAAPENEGHLVDEVRK